LLIQGKKNTKMCETFPATNDDLYAVVDLTKKKFSSHISAKNKASDIPIYHVIEHNSIVSPKEKECAHQKTPHDLYSKISFSKKSQKSNT